MAVSVLPSRTVRVALAEATSKGVEARHVYWPESSTTATVIIKALFELMNLLLVESVETFRITPSFSHSTSSGVPSSPLARHLHHTAPEVTAVHSSILQHTCLHLICWRK